MVYTCFTPYSHLFQPIFIQTMHQIIPQGIRRAILILLSVWLICCTCSPAAFAYEEKTDQAPTLTYAPAVTFGVADTGFKLPSFDFDFDFGGIFEESCAFPTGSKVIQFGLGLGSTVNLKQLSAELNLIDARRRIPHLSFLYERRSVPPMSVQASLQAIRCGPFPHLVIATIIIPSA